MLGIADSHGAYRVAATHDSLLCHHIHHHGGKKKQRNCDAHASLLPGLVLRCHPVPLRRDNNPWPSSDSAPSSPMRPLSFLLVLLSVFCSLFSRAAGTIHTIAYPASTQPGELIFKSVYRLWIPEGAKQLRAVIVHQHGCGVGSWKNGLTAADDLHWQALAKKWD